MRLENILALTNGRLVNDPFVKKFETIVFEAKDVKRGDLFIAFDEEMIEEAIFNGAYGIIFDKPTQITDTEIAWIKVKECEDSLKKLLRFRLIEKNITAYECNEIILKLSLQVITDQNFIPVHGDIKSIHKALWNLDDNATLLFCPEISDTNIFTDVQKLPPYKNGTISVVEETLFEISFIYNDVFYERQTISPFFIPYLERLLHLYKMLHINFRLRKFSQLDHFEAVFVSTKFETKEFGASDKVLIFEKSLSLVKGEIEFLQKNASWANVLYILPLSEKENYENDFSIFTYTNKKDIFTILENNYFHFALIIGRDSSILQKPIQTQTQLLMEF